TDGTKKKRKPSRTMASPKRPSRPTSAGMSEAGSVAGPSASTKCRPTRKLGKRRARSTASCAAGAATIRLAAFSTPSRCARSTAAFTRGCSPKSSAVTIRARRPERVTVLRLVRPQEAEELDAFAQTALHHVPARQHLAHNLPDLRRAEVELLIELLEMVIDLVARQMRIADRRELHAFLAHEVDRLVLFHPAVLDGLLVERRARIRRGERNLDRVRVDF